MKNLTIGHVVVDQYHLTILLARSNEGDEVAVAELRQHFYLVPELMDALVRRGVRALHGYHDRLGLVGDAAAIDLPEPTDAEEELPFADDTFGVVVLSGAIHHFYRPKDALAQIARVLCPGGRLCVIEPRMPPVFRELLNGYLRLFSHDGDCRFYSPRKLAALLAGCGFTSDKAPTYPGGLSYMIVASKSNQT